MGGWSGDIDDDDDYFLNFFYSVLHGFGFDLAMSIMSYETFFLYDG